MRPPARHRRFLLRGVRAPHEAISKSRRADRRWNFTADAWLGWNGTAFVQQDVNVSRAYSADTAVEPYRYPPRLVQQITKSLNASMRLAPWPYPPLLFCGEAYIDCSNASQVNRTIYPARCPT